MVIQRTPNVLSVFQEHGREGMIGRDGNGEGSTVSGPIRTHTFGYLSLFPQDLWS